MEPFADHVRTRSDQICPSVADLLHGQYSTAAGVTNRD